jgi:hypothetical protein
VLEQAETARNPYTVGRSSGDPSRSNTPNAINGLVWQIDVPVRVESKELYAALANQVST